MTVWAPCVAVKPFAGPYPFAAANLLKLFSDAQVFVVALVGLVLRIRPEVLESEGSYDREFYGNVMLVLLIGTLLPATATLFYKSPVERALASLQEIAISLPDVADPLSTATTSNVVQMTAASDQSQIVLSGSQAGNDDDLEIARAPGLPDHMERRDGASNHIDRHSCTIASEQGMNQQGVDPASRTVTTMQAESSGTTCENDQNSSTNTLRERSSTPPRKPPDRNRMQDTAPTGWEASQQVDHDRDGLYRVPPPLPPTRQRRQRSATPPRADHATNP